MYDEFNSFADAKTAYRRCRTRKHFILSDEAAEKDNPVCARCGKPYNEHKASPGYHGNRCEYDPRTKKIAFFQYVCAWEALMHDVFQATDEKQTRKVTLY